MSRRSEGDPTVRTDTAAPTRRRARFHRLRVADVRALTADAVEVAFAVPDELADAFDYAPGQYVALRTVIDGVEVRRSYSICRPPVRGAIAVGIKRDPGGRFSTWAHTALRPGDEIDVMSPQGTFVSARADAAAGHVVGIAAGSGITPIMSLAASVLSASTTSRFTLVYTNRSSTDVMFVDELADLKDRYPARIAVHHVLSREQRAAPVLSGRIDEERLRLILTAIIRPETVDEWFLCGPFALVQLCRDVLADLGVDADRVRFELFTTGEATAPATALGRAGGRPRAARPDERVHRIDLTLDGTSTRVDSPVDAHESILTAALRVRPDVPFACAGGVCGTCRARLVSGSVQMRENYALEPEEIERGYVLTCQSHPTTARVVVDYDV
ncbi:phenylacetate-CoA oxygenase/reductase subunit PaaK [Microbacterium hominis]|uniref:1,2-phenylacetyl-CoA epoxidase subunit PaaE n=1 Tax=Microbacterium hominis TaxID=162426 RepID=UPI0019666A17|nr:phenylacetate-CoA oxygenase/reductase subunit PaaK [Microbacterium hominis]